MLKYTFTGPFKKDHKLMKKRNKDMDKLTEVMDLLINELPLPPERKNHPLHGEWEGAWDCHIQGDWLLIYETDDAAGTITFHHTGSHSDLF
ncbi:MAG: type II toxin-antitoxin system YafQ family toxin [Treponema sp.]|jgi:mRNA interferase YafQ|nr:type II toxin-antitoxin system YafQ family toxin [Treponema sp.]